MNEKTKKYLKYGAYAIGIGGAGLLTYYLLSNVQGNNTSTNTQSNASYTPINSAPPVSIYAGSEGFPLSSGETTITIPTTSSGFNHSLNKVINEGNYLENNSVQANGNLLPQQNLSAPVQPNLNMPLIHPFAAPNQPIYQPFF